MKLNRPLITFASFISLGLNGVVFTFMGVSLPVLQTYLDIDIERAGTLMASFQTGFTIFTFIGGIYSDHFRREWILAFGCFSLSVGSALLCIVQTYWLGLAVVCLMGAGIGFILSGSNTLLVMLYPDRKGAILNIHHVFFGIGSIIGPALMGILIIQGDHWRFGYIAVSFALLMLCFMFSFSRNKVEVSGNSQQRAIRQLWDLVSDRKYQVLLMASFFNVGSQVIIILFGAVFLIQGKDCTLGEAGAALTVFSMFIVLGRLGCSKLTLTIKHTSIVLALFWLQAFILLLLWWSHGWFSLIVLAFSGIAFSGTFPTLLALTSILFPQREGAALGLLSTMGGLGSIILCWLTGFVAGLTSVEIGFTVTLIACFGALVLFQTNYRSLSRREHCANTPNSYKPLSQLGKKI